MDSDEEAQALLCAECGYDQFDLGEEGFYICRECGQKLQGIVDEQVEYGDVGVARSGNYVYRQKTAVEKGRSRKLVKDTVSGSEVLVAFQSILMAQVETMVKDFRCSERLYDAVHQVWMRFLETATEHIDLVDTKDPVILWKDGGYSYFFGFIPGGAGVAKGENVENLAGFSLYGKPMRTMKRKGKWKKDYIQSRKERKRKKKKMEKEAERKRKLREKAASKRGRGRGLGRGRGRGRGRGLVDETNKEPESSSSSSTTDETSDSEEDSSSDENDENEEGTVSFLLEDNTKVLLKREHQLSIGKTLSFLSLGLRILRAGFTDLDINRLAVVGKIPYLTAYTKLQGHQGHILRGDDSPLRPRDEVPSPVSIGDGARDIWVAIKQGAGGRDLDMFYPTENVHLLIYRLVGELGLPDAVSSTAEQILTHLGKHSREASTLLDASAVFVVATKATLEIFNEGRQPEGCTFDWKKWYNDVVKMINVCKLSPKYSRDPVRNERGAVQWLHQEGDVKEYLKYVEDNIFTTCPVPEGTRVYKDHMATMNANGKLDSHNAKSTLKGLNDEASRLDVQKGEPVSQGEENFVMSSQPTQDFLGLGGANDEDEEEQVREVDCLPTDERNTRTSRYVVYKVSTAGQFHVMYRTLLCALEAVTSLQPNDIHKRLQALETFLFSAL